MIPPATPIKLTTEELLKLGALAQSRKSEARMRERARIVLLAANGQGSRAIARVMHCPPAIASKWRVRYASRRGPARSLGGANPLPRAREAGGVMQP